MRATDAEVFDVMIVLDKCWTDEEGDVADFKTLDHEVLDSFETEKEAINYATYRKDDAENVRVIKEGSTDPILTFHDGEKKYEQDSHAAD